MPEGGGERDKLKSRQRERRRKNLRAVRMVGGIREGRSRTVHYSKVRIILGKPPIF